MYKNRANNVFKNALKVYILIDACACITGITYLVMKISTWCRDNLSYYSESMTCSHWRRYKQVRI